MAQTKAEEILSEINDKVDPLQLALLLNYYPAKIQDAGGQIKLFCPLHKEQAFRSLTLDGAAHTYRCMMKRCEGFEGGTLVELWSKHSGQPILDAALDLAEKLKLGLDVQALRMIGSEMTAKAREALTAAQMDVARQFIDQALSFDSRDIEARKISAQIYLRSGYKEQANEEFVRVIDLYLENGQVDQARQLLNPLLQTNPKQVELALRRVMIARADGIAAGLAEALLVLSVLYAQSAQPEKELQALDELVAITGIESKMLERVVDIHQRSERTPKVMEALERLAPVYEANKDWAKLCGSLERRASYSPQDLAVQEQLAAAYLKTGNKERAARQFLQVAELCKVQGDYTHAQSVLMKLLDADPSNMAAMEQLADLAGRTGARRDAIDIYRKLAQASRETGKLDEAARYLGRAKDIDPNDTRLRMDLAETQLQHGNIVDGVAELFSVADVFLTESDPAEGFKVLERIAALDPANTDQLIQIGHSLEAAGYDDQAVEQYLRIAGGLIERGAHEDALRVCEEARRLQPLNPALIEARVQCNLALGRKAEAVQVCREVAQAYLRSGEMNQAEVVLQRAIGIDPEDAAVKVDRAQALETAGREADSVEAWIEISRLHQGRSSFQESVDSAREALRMSPESIDAQRVLAGSLEAMGFASEAFALWRSAGDLLLAGKGGEAEALAIFEHALRIAPDDFDLLARTAELKYMQDGADAARPLYDAWIERLQNSGDSGALVDAFAQAVAAYPQETPWLAQYAELLISHGEFDAALPHVEKLLVAYRLNEEFAAERIRLLETVVEHSPDRLDLHLELADSLADSGSIPQAVRIFGEIATQYLSRGDQQGGLDVLLRSLKHQPENRELLMRIGELQERLGRLDEAVATYELLVNLSRRIDTWRSNVAVVEKMLLLAPERVDLRLELARSYESHGEIENAVDQYYRVAKVRVKQDVMDGETLYITEKLVSLSQPDFTAGRELLVTVYLARGDFEKAKNELDQLGDTALKAQDLDRAEGYFKRIQEVDPKDIGSGERLGKLYEARGEPQRAHEAYTQVLGLYEQLKDSDRIISVLRKLKALAPKDLDLRLRLARGLMAAEGKENEATEEWYDTIALAVSIDKLSAAKAAMKEAGSLFSVRWDYRFKIIQLFGGVQDPQQTVKAWLSFAEQALAAGQDRIVREAATEALELAAGDERLLEIRIEANKRLEDFDAAEGDLLTMAAAATKADRHEDAERYIERALEMKPSSTELLAMLVAAHEAQGDAPSACTTLRRLAEIHIEVGDLPAAVDAGRRIVELDPTSIERKDFLAGLLLENGDTDQAMEVWREVGEQLAAEGKLEEAIERFQAILNNSDRDIGATRRVADLTRESRGCEAAEPVYERLLDMMIAEGSTTGEMDAEFRRVLQLEPEQLALAEKYASYLFASGMMDGAARELFRISRIHQDERGDYHEALRVIRMLREWDSANLDVLREEASILVNLGEKEKAVQVLSDVAASYRLGGDDVKAAETVAQSADILSDQVAPQIEAGEAFEMIAEDNRATEFYLRAVSLHEGLDEHQEAIPLLKRAIGLNPDRIDLGERLGAAFEKTGQLEHAVAQWIDVGGLCEAGSRSDEAAEMYRHVKAIAPAEMEPRRRLARIAKSAGDVEAALAELREMTPIAEEQGEYTDAVAILGEILELAPRDIPTLIRLAGLHRREGERGALFATLAELEEVYSASGDLPAAIGVMNELLELRPNDLDLARRNFDLMVKTGDTEGASALGLRLVETYFDSREEEKARELTDRIIGIEPVNTDRRVQLARLAFSQSYTELALELFRKGARELLDLDAKEAALGFVGSGLGFFPDEIDLRRTKIATHIALGQRAEASAELMNLAGLFEMQGEDEAALKTLDEILESDPNNEAAHENIVRLAVRADDIERVQEHLVQLAEIHYVGGNLGEAIKALERLLEHVPSRNDLRSRLAELHHEAGNAEEARHVWFSAAEEHRGGEELEAAIEIYQRVRDLYPEDLDTLARLTECLREAGNDEEYLKHAMTLGAGYSAGGQFHEATHLYNSLAEHFPKNIEITESLAGAYSRSGESAKAVEAYRRLSDLHQANRRFDLARGVLDLALKLDPADINLLEQMGETCLRLNQRPEGLGYLGMAAERLKGQGRFDDARQIIEKILKIDPSNLETRRILGSVCEAMGDHPGAIKNYGLAARGWSERRSHVQAIDMFEHLLALDPALQEEREAYAQVLEREGRKDDACNQYLVLIENARGEADPRQVIRYCRQILKDNPDHVAAHENLYVVYEKTKKPRLALEEAQWLADYFISIGELDRAEEFIRRGLEQAPAEIELRKRFVEILIETGRNQEAAQNLSELAASARAGGDLRTAKWALNRACESEPSNLTFRQELAQLLELGGEIAEGRKVRLDIMRINLAQGEMDEARAMAERIMQSAPSDEDLRGRIAEIFETAGLPEVAAFHYTHMAQAALERQEFPRAIELCNKVLKIKPRHVQARDCLVKALTATGDSAGIAHHSRELYTLYFDAGDLESAHLALKNVIQQKPSEPEPRRLLIDLYRRMRKPDQMIEQMRRLAEIFANAGDIDKAVQSLRDLMQERPDDTRARARYIDLYSQVGEESDLYKDYLHLALILRRKGAVVEAMQVYEKLLQLVPDRWECREQFVEFLFEQGQDNRGIEEARRLIDLYLKNDMKPEAGKMLERALGKNRQDTQMRHQLATLQLRTNRRGMALETLRGLLKQYEEKGNDALQVSVIEQTLEIDNLNVELRERLAELYVRIGQTDQAKEQRLLLAQQYLNRQLYDLAEREYRRIIEIQPNDVDSWVKVIETHLHIGSELEVIPDMMSLAQVYAELGRMRDAVGLYAKLRELDPENILILSRYIESYLQIGMEEDLLDDYIRLATLLGQAGNVEGALKIYQHLQELAPENTRVKLGLSGGDPDEPFVPVRETQRAIPILSPEQKLSEFIKADEPAAQSFDQPIDAQLEKAIRNYENILKLNPENPAVRAKLAELIAKTGRMKEADEQWQQAANDFFNRGEYDKCIEILEELVGRHPEDARLRERLSRAILQRESVNAIGSIVMEGPK